MYTRCPHCQTVYRIQAKALQSAQGQAHCYHCCQIFNALEQLQEAEAPPPDSELSFPEITLTEQEQTAPTGRHTIFLNEAMESATEEPAPEPTTDETPPPQMEAATETPDANLPLSQEPDDTGPRPATSDETEPTAITEPPTAANEPTEPDDDLPTLTEPNGQGNTLPFDVPEDLPAIEPSEEADPFGDAPAPPARKNYHWILWGIGSIPLLLLLLGQLTWFQREALMHHPQGQVLLEMACQVADCQLPQSRDPRQIEILNREIKTHPSEKGALLLQLFIANRAPFAQPYPLVELSLYNTEEQLIARRNFRPREYLKPGQEGSRLMPSDSSEYIELILEDPGSQVTGFKFDFR